MSARTLASLGIASVLSAVALPVSAFPPADGSFSLSLSAAHKSFSVGGYETRASIELTFPLDRFAVPALPRGGVAQSSDDAAQGSDDAAQPREAADAEAAASESSDAESVFVAPLDHRLAREAVEAALRAAGYPASRARLDSLESRARSSAALPRLRLRGAHGTDETLRLAPTASDPYRYTRSGGNDLLLEARLTWRLDRLVFADEELGVERLRSQRAAARAKLVERVLGTLFEWQRAHYQAKNRLLLPDERALARLAALEAELRLDVLTGGWFGRWLERRREAERIASAERKRAEQRRAKQRRAKRRRAKQRRARPGAGPSAGQVDTEVERPAQPADSEPELSPAKPEPER